MEFFEAIKTYFIAKIDGTFEEVAGTRLTDEYFAHKSDVRGFGWTITDTASGLSIATKLPTLKACKDYLASLTDEQLTEIERIRQTEKYKDQCAKLAGQKPVIQETFDFMDAFETLDGLYESNYAQKNIFNF